MADPSGSKSYASSAFDQSTAEGPTNHDAMDALFEIAGLLNTGLDRQTLSICLALCEAGVNPEALAAVIKELRAEQRAAAAVSATPTAGAGSASTATGPSPY
ncbi:hypothetical protein GGF32_003847 [Allomyces javanicus]|nr:hypothetical protein GGF32_003847 [Allomyces javanicus]